MEFSRIKKIVTIDNSPKSMKLWRNDKIAKRKEIGICKTKAQTRNMLKELC